MRQRQLFMGRVEQMELFSDYKKGKEGKVSVNARVETSFSSPTERVKIADPVTYMRMQNEAIKTRDPMGLAMYSEEKIGMTAAGRYPHLFPAINWYDTMLKAPARRPPPLPGQAARVDCRPLSLPRRGQASCFSWGRAPRPSRPPPPKTGTSSAALSSRPRC